MCAASIKRDDISNSMLRVSILVSIAELLASVGKQEGEYSEIMPIFFSQRC